MTVVIMHSFAMLISLQIVDRSSNEVKLNVGMHAEVVALQ